MFRLWQTKTIFVLAIVIAFLVCSIGLMLRRRSDAPGEVVLKLEVPKIPPLYTEVQREKKNEDEGKTIVLD
jgi:hypothetical protein